MGALPSASGSNTSSTVSTTSAPWVYRDVREREWDAGDMDGSRVWHGSGGTPGSGLGPPGG
ncbi:hypothetical protein ACN28I_22485 [Archangium gephyra]|uniref:hypothetical protein n=1 Tax=Archangium gephyra TaxID=48 RepID=UPI003B7D2DAF